MRYARPRGRGVGRTILRRSQLVALFGLALSAEPVKGAPECILDGQAVERPYRDLEDALSELREIHATGGWTSLPPGRNLDAGIRDRRVVLLRDRLRMSADFPKATSGSGDPLLLEPALREAVRVFQWRHGLEVDGVVGPRTAAALNVPVTERIAQVEANLQRWKQLPDELGSRYFIVNIADFTVDLFEEGERVRRLPIIVGRPDRPTPEFSAEMTQIVLSPYWHVPPGIARADLIPLIRVDPTHLSRNRMVLLETATNLPLDPESVDWGRITGSEFNDVYRLRADPGEMNPLGSVKFLFPNEHDVYMHDTPSRELFSRRVRTFSSGCVRVMGAVELAAHLLREDPTWTLERMRRIIERGVEESVPLPTPYQVHIGYWTAWVDEDGILHFRDDVYGRDREADPALEVAGPR